MSKITALVVENPPTFQCKLREVLQKEPDILVVGEAAGEMEALELARRLKPDVILLNTRLDLQFVRQLHRENGMAAVMMLAADANNVEARDTFRAGGSAYCGQNISTCMLKQALHQVALGHYVLGDQVFDKEGLLAKLAARPKTNLTLPARQTRQLLSRREMDILQCLTQGLSNKEIALVLGISQQTVKNHMTSMLSKLRAVDRTQMAVYALRHGLVRLQDT
jgi:DNA-binding NarL/FixJ family response regulator